MAGLHAIFTSNIASLPGNADLHKSGYKYRNVETYKRTNVQTYKRTNVQTYKCRRAELNIGSALSIWENGAAEYRHRDTYGVNVKQKKIIS
jgi:hypothetical protein